MPGIPVPRRSSQLAGVLNARWVWVAIHHPNLTRAGLSQQRESSWLWIACVKCCRRHFVSLVFQATSLHHPTHQPLSPGILEPSSSAASPLQRTHTNRTHLPPEPQLPTGPAHAPPGRTQPRGFVPATDLPSTSPATRQSPRTHKPPINKKPPTQLQNLPSKQPIVLATPLVHFPRSLTLLLTYYSKPPSIQFGPVHKSPRTISPRRVEYSTGPAHPRLVRSRRCESRVWT